MVSSSKSSGSYGTSKGSSASSAGYGGSTPSKSSGSYGTSKGSSASSAGYGGSSKSSTTSKSSGSYGTSKGSSATSAGYGGSTPSKSSGSYGTSKGSSAASAGYSSGGGGTARSTPTGSPGYGWGGGSRAAGVAADRASVAGYAGGTPTGGGTRAAGVAADRASVANYAGKSTSLTTTGSDVGRYGGGTWGTTGAGFNRAAAERYQGVPAYGGPGEGVGGGPGTRTPTGFAPSMSGSQARQSEIASMAALGGMQDNSARQVAEETRRRAEALGRYVDAVYSGADKERRANLATQYRESEMVAAGRMADWGKQVKSVVAAGPGWTQVALNDGTVERRTGLRSVRNNNPGNIEYGSFAKKHGAIGTDGRFAVFSSVDDGIAAQASLLGNYAKRGATIGSMISAYAPSTENDVGAYTKSVTDKIGLSPNTKMSDLSPQQMNDLARAMQNVEGVGAIRTAQISPATKDYASMADYYGATGQAAYAAATPPERTTVAAGTPATPAPGFPPAPNVPLPNRAPKPTPRDQPAYKRGLGGWVQAIGTDVLMGTNPVTMGANILSLLTTGDTVGGTIADAMRGKYGENYYNPGGPQSPGSQDGGGGRFSGTTRSKAEPYTNAPTPTGTTPEQAAEEVTTTPTTPAETFVKKYIDPQPAQEIPRETIPNPVYDWVPKAHSPILPYSWETT